MLNVDVVFGEFGDINEDSNWEVVVDGMVDDDGRQTFEEAFVGLEENFGGLQLNECCSLFLN